MRRRREDSSLDESNQLVLHPLLAEYLIAGLSDAPEHTVIEPLVEALLQRRLWDECLHLAEAMPKVQTFASQVLEQALEYLLRTGRVATVDRWLAVARSLGLEKPIFELAEGEIAFRDGAYYRAIVFGSDASHRRGEPDFQARALVLAGRAAHLSDKADDAKRMFREAEAVAASPSIKADAIWGQVVVDYEDEGDQLEQTLVHFEAAGDGGVGHDLRLSVGTIMVARLRGSVAGAVESVEATLARVSSCNDPLLRLAALNICGTVLVASARYDKSLHLSDRLMHDALESGITFPVSHALVNKAGALTGLRQFASAARACSDLSRRLQSGTIRLGKHKPRSSTSTAPDQSRRPGQSTTAPARRPS